MVSINVFKATFDLESTSSCENIIVLSVTYLQSMCLLSVKYHYYLGMRKSALIGCRSHRGGWLSAISSAVIPSDQRSERLSYVASGFSSHAITSGAIQYGVPMNVFLLPIVLSSCADTPKSTKKIISDYHFIISYERRCNWL